MINRTFFRHVPDWGQGFYTKPRRYSRAAPRSVVSVQDQRNPRPLSDRYQDSCRGGEQCLAHTGRSQLRRIRPPATSDDLPDIQETVMKTFMLSAEPFRLITVATIAALTLTCSSASIAGDDGHVPQTIVRFGDLSPGTAQGAARLYRRIVAA